MENLPSDLKKEVEDFIEFLLEKKKKAEETNTSKRKRIAGTMKGLITISPDFDEPLEDFKEYM